MYNILSKNWAELEEFDSKNLPFWPFLTDSEIRLSKVKISLETSKNFKAFSYFMTGFHNYFSHMKKGKIVKSAIFQRITRIV